MDRWMRWWTAVTDSLSEMCLHERRRQRRRRPPPRALAVLRVSRPTSFGRSLDFRDSGVRNVFLFCRPLAVRYLLRHVSGTR